ncbi:bZIP transcription factor [Colletotrichum karsti]|uniref:Putative transcription factor kapC n=1 Tax=Colletotrichum karsti TaxID=1095194 RepID=A0A9P6IJZ1_9PEZI|nr:bZIP transcription factor [Colletotrichum karsti]KAF9882055.1 bZIP transcription factor [Colletotrichum karsti]
MEHPLPLNMLDDIDAFLELEAPYGYDETEQYLDTASSSQTPSPIMSTFDMGFVGDFNGTEHNIYPSPMSSTRDTASPQPSSDQKPAVTAAKPPAKRKRENRYKNAPPSVLSRRRAQNRASQRAYRERKDQRIKDLEVMLSEQKNKNDSLSQAYSALHAEYLKLRGSQARAQHQQQMPRHHHHPATAPPPPPLAFDPSAHMGMPTAHPGAMDYADNMYMFQDMQTYTL